MSQSLFEISQDMQALDDLMNELGGDVSDEKSAAAVEAWVKELTEKLSEKADNYCALVSTMEARAKIREGEIERLQRLVDSDKSAAKYLKIKLKMVMEQKGMAKLETKRFRISICGNGGRCPLTIFDDKLLPPTFFIPQPDIIDSDSVYEKLNTGQDVPGARLEPRGTHLRIK